MENYENTIFISCAWGGEREDIVNQIDQALQKHGLKITRDKRDLAYKRSIKEFMERIGQAREQILNAFRDWKPGIEVSTFGYFPANFLQVRPNKKSFKRMLK